MNRVEAALVLTCLLVGAVAGNAQSASKEPCVVEGPSRYACVERDSGGRYQVYLQIGAGSRTEALPGRPRAVQLGSARDVVFARGGLPGVAGSDDGANEGQWWTRLIGLDGPVLSADGPRLHGLAETGDWLAMQVVQLAPADTQDFDRGITEPWASSEAPLVVYGWDGREVRRLPGLRVFERYPEDEDDEYEFSADGRAIAVYRAERRSLDLYGLDGVVIDETLDLEELVPGFAPREFAFINADRIVMWQPEMFGRNQAQWLRVLSRDESGRFVSKSIVHRDGYTDLWGISRGGLILFSGLHGFDVVNPSGELVWRLDRAGWTEILELVPERDLRGWRPVMLLGGALRLRDTRARALGTGRDEVIVRFTEVDEKANGDWDPGHEVVIGGETQPLAKVASVAVLPVGAAVDGEGRYMLIDRALGPQPLKGSATREVVEH